MSIYEPGAVAVATVRGVPNVRVMRSAQVHSGHIYLWTTDRVIDNSAMFRDADVTDVRPLVVLDLDDTEARTLRDWLRGTLAATPQKMLSRIADQIEEQVTSPRIPEPGLWGVVKASVTHEGCEYEVKLVRHPGAVNPWQATDGHWFDWSELVDPVLVRDGIEDGVS